MKKVIFMLAFMLMGTFAFANSNTNIINNLSEVKNSIEITFELEDLTSLLQPIYIKIIDGSDDCFDRAIEALEEAGDVDDETGTDILNEEYARCWCESNNDPNCDNL